MKKLRTKQFGANITLEAAIIVPIVMLVVAGMIYVTMYVHDVIVLRSKAYEVGIEYSLTNESKDKTLSKLREVSLFVVNPKVEICEQMESYVIKISLVGKGDANIIYTIVNSGKEQKIYVPKKMSREILYGSKVLIEELEERKGK